MDTMVKTREAWLLEAVEILRPRFVEVGLPIPEKVRVSVGFGAGVKGESNMILGVTWAARASEDNTPAIFVSPVVADTARVLDILLHELIHAADDCESGHKGRFAEAATRLGLEGPMKATTASITLAAELLCISEALGEYPHSALTGAVAKVKTPVGPDGAPVPPIHTGPKKQGTRMLKCECPCCGYVVRTTAKWLEIGVPKCPSGTDMIEA